MTEVAGLRQLVAALVLVLVVRPRLTGRPGRQWVLIGVFGVAIASMNVAFYQALERIPLGVAATLLYLGPFVLAVTGIRKRWEILLPLVALAGVALVARPTGDVTAAGVLLGLASAVALAAYTLASGRAGEAEGGMDVLALAIVFSAALLTPVSLPAVPDVAPDQWPALAYSGGVGVALAFFCDYTALRLTGVRLVATLFALDPVIGAVLGVLLLDDVLSLGAKAGIVLICAVGAFVTSQTSREKGGPTPPDEMSR